MKEAQFDMDIRDYLHLYWGCKCLYRYPTGKRGWASGSVKGITMQRIMKEGYECRLVLRPLSSMTEEEQQWWFDSLKKPNERFDFGEWVIEENGLPCTPHWVLWVKNWNYSRYGYNVGIDNHFTVHQYTWLLSKHFDVFGLIESGLAIDQQTSPLQRGEQTK